MGKVRLLVSAFIDKASFITTFAEYASFAYSINPNEAVLLLSFLIPGNVYPVIEDPKEAQSLSGTKLKVH